MNWTNKISKKKNNSKKQRRQITFENSLHKIDNDNKQNELNHQKRLKQAELERKKKKKII